jgi:Fe-S cluster assembly iron-binding protein IscA
MTAKAFTNINQLLSQCWCKLRIQVTTSKISNFHYWLTFSTKWRARARLQPVHNISGGNARYNFTFDPSERCCGIWSL